MMPLVLASSDASARPRRFASLLLLALGLISAPALAQLGPGATPAAETLVKASAAPVTITAGGKAEARFELAIQKTWHINANPASPDYMIATALEFTGTAGVTTGAPIYPAPAMLNVEFENDPLLVLDGTVTVRLPLAAAGSAVNGKHVLKGKLRFQACNDQVCLAPVTIPVELTVTVTGGAEAGTPAVTTTDGGPGGEHAPPAGEDSLTGAPTTGEGTPTDSAAPTNSLRSGSFSTGPGSGGTSAINNPIARALERGGWASFLTLFFVGLALNLTPCVYPMIGVTVSIFGARRSAPPLQVFGNALVYVLGMAVMYSSLGLAAAFTGGLFGGMLSNPLVLIVIGVLLFALALSMFGLYEIQVPPALLSRLGGTAGTSLVGLFISGLVVGIFAAPCVGPPVVALLAVVGAKGDPWFGFWSFFVLALGLGVPYLVLGTFSNLIQTLPRSGDWMVWVKKVFGMILATLGIFYVLLALAPDLGVWVPPAALILGGVWLGFFEKSAEKRAGFRFLKRATGVVAVLSGVVMVITAPTEGLAFEAFTPAALEQARQSGTPVMLDFTANWCAPCHELERFTFTDRKVRAAARAFRTLRVDLTRYDSPESEGWRRQYRITGVPTVLFIMPDGKEVEAARVEGFMPPEPFLERMELAAQRAK